MSTEKKQLCLKIDLSPEHLEILNNDFKRINEALNKACKAGTFDLKEAGMLGVSIENFGHLIFSLTNSAKNLLEKTNENLDKKQ